MAFPEYQLRQYFHGLVREKGQQAKWNFGKKKQSSSALSLEEEIYQLRLKLAERVQQDKSLTSPEVVEISMMLDKKINEYMSHNKKSR